MKIGAVICEYNPFHNGHQYLIQTAKEELGLDGVVGLMSGNFVQRGDAAIYPKELRAKAAIAGGVNLVLELPTILTLQSAERYAAAAVETLDQMGCVDTLFFGAETPDIDILNRIAAVLCQEDTAYLQQLKAALSEGMSYAAARAKAVCAVIGPHSAAILNQPNNILAVEYCKALFRLQSKIKPHAIPRRGTPHDAPSPHEAFASASYLREQILSGMDTDLYIPAASAALYRDMRPFSVSKMESALLAHLALSSLDDLKRVADVTEGLENALKRAVFSASSLHDVIMAAKSKRYAYSRIRRILLCSYLGITQNDLGTKPSYIRILDFDEVGQKILHDAKKTATLPPAKNGAQIKDKKEARVLWQREASIDRVYHIFSDM